jgi:hypothetical protein
MKLELLPLRVMLNLIHHHLRIVCKRDLIVLLGLLDEVSIDEVFIYLDILNDIC